METVSVLLILNDRQFVVPKWVATHIYDMFEKYNNIRDKWLPVIAEVTIRDLIRRHSVPLETTVPNEILTVILYKFSLQIQWSSTHCHV